MTKTHSNGEPRATRSRRAFPVIGASWTIGIAGGVLWQPSASGGVIAEHIAVVCLGLATSLFAWFPIRALLLLPRSLHQAFHPDSGEPPKADR